MARIEDLAERYGRHIATPWQRTVAGAQRVVMVVYDKELERTLRARILAFETPPTRPGTIGVKSTFPAPSQSGWLPTTIAMNTSDRRRIFSSSSMPSFPSSWRNACGQNFRSPMSRANTVVAVLGVGSLFGFARISQVLKIVEADIRGRLVVFFPGQFERNNYRLLDARDGWNYLAVPITLHGEGGTT